MSFSKLQELTCILQCDESCSTADSIENITEEKWENIQKKLLEWKGLDKFGNVYEQINWSNGHKYLYMHKNPLFDNSVNDGNSLDTFSLFIFSLYLQPNIN